MVGVGSTPALLYVLSLFALAVFLMYVAIRLPIYFKSKGVDMGALHFMVTGFLLVASNYVLGLGINATGTVTSLT